MSLNMYLYNDRYTSVPFSMNKRPVHFASIFTSGAGAGGDCGRDAYSGQSLALHYIPVWSSARERGGRARLVGHRGAVASARKWRAARALQALSSSGVPAST